MVLIALAAFIILGFIRDGSKVFSSIALVIGVALLFVIYQNDLAQETREAIRKEQDDALYTVRYETACSDCNVRYTNRSGGTDAEKSVPVRWSRTLQIKGNQFINFSAQNTNYSGKIFVRLYINDKLFKEESSSGEYAIANISCRPKDINVKLQ
ncbi:hypothetical protein GCM10028810_01950 [Spirosoma litoris]